MNFATLKQVVPLRSGREDEPVGDLRHELLLARYEPGTELHLEVRGPAEVDLGVNREEGVIAEDAEVEEDLQSYGEVLLHGVEDGVVDHDAVQANLVHLVGVVSQQTFTEKLINWTLALLFEIQLVIKIGLMLYVFSSHLNKFIN